MKILKIFSVAVAALALAGPAMAQTFFDEGITLQGKKIDLGFAGRVYKWAAISRRGNVEASTLAITSPANIDFEGNVGVAGKTSNLTLANSRIEGDLYIREGGTAFLSGSGGWSGTKFQSESTDAILDKAASDIGLLSLNVNSLSKTTNFSLSGFKDNDPANLSKIKSAGAGDNTSSNNLTIDGTVNNPFNEPIVLQLSHFALKNDNGTQLTLIGGATTRFIVNVTKQFLLSKSADVLLSGGLQAGNVIFNATDKRGSSLRGGSTLEGVLVSIMGTGTASLSEASEITGQLIGKKITLSGGSKIKKPKKPSP